MGFIIISAVLAVLILAYGLSVYNKLIRKRAMMEEGWSGIDVQLKKRYNLIPNLVETVKGFAKHEQETLEKVIQARNSALNAQGVEGQQQAENMLTKALGGIFALSEAYPELKSNTNFLQLQQELASIEGDIEKARRYYNATVRENNILVESVPSNLVAGAFNFKLGPFFEIELEEERATPKVKF